ncbi:endo-1,4-beta-xylanase [Mucisphaera calidilacus]|uniref:endo-1,4-beta-xylanase n=1 Tax=Mucisphaera calidilacus TaxID=2527982 RepID=A0A518BU65_9BACT|nr:endo-1,4-beta-xylanase [Mucisphaera calidilacus]QDU70528.1 Endo-1,4-beta-xylanase B precursor [Mucisphaera calidilacus]
MAITASRGVVTTWLLVVMAVCLSAVQGVEAQPNPLPDDLIQQLGPDARLIIHGNRPDAFNGPGDTDHARMETVRVDGQPLHTAARIHVLRKTDPVWDASLTSPWTTAPIRKGDTLFGYIDIRAESEKESGGGQFTGWLQGNRSGWSGLRQVDGAPGGQWSRRYFTTVATRDYDKGEVNFVLHLGIIPQTVDVANILVWNLGPDADIASLPSSRLTYEGQEPDALWRVEAMQRIDRYRKSDLEVRVVDARGRGVAGAEVEVALERHAFGFGTFIGNGPVLQDSPDGERFRNTLHRYFNRITCPAYNAQTWGWPNPATANNYIRQIEWSRRDGYTTKAHPVLWSRFDWSPDAWVALRGDPPALRRAIEDYIRKTMTLLSELGVEEVDFFNEPDQFDEYNQVIRAQNLTADWFKLAHETAPNIRLGINEKRILSAGGRDTDKHDNYFATIQHLLDEGVPLRAIGFQGHMGEDFTPPTRLWTILDRFAAFGIPLHVTEFDVNTEDEQTQADYTRDFLLAMMAHPAVDSVTLWGFWGGDMWIPQAALWQKNWQPRPNGEAYIDLMTKTLNTHERLRTDTSGRVAARAFKGDYVVRVRVDEKRGEVRVRLGDEPGVVQVTVR